MGKIGIRNFRAVKIATDTHRHFFVKVVSMVWMVEMVWKVKSIMFVSNLLFETRTFSLEPCALSLSFQL
jgi:hypothetical protein